MSFTSIMSRTKASEHVFFNSLFWSILSLASSDFCFKCLRLPFMVHSDNYISTSCGVFFIWLDVVKGDCFDPAILHLCCLLWIFSSFYVAELDCVFFFFFPEIAPKRGIQPLIQFPLGLCWIYFIFGWPVLFVIKSPLTAYCGFTTSSLRFQEITVALAPLGINCLISENLKHP